MDRTTIIGICYLISIPYVIWRIIKRYEKTSFDGVIGATPGFDFTIFITFAPFWMAADLIATWSIMIYDYIKLKKDR